MYTFHVCVCVSGIRQWMTNASSMINKITPSVDKNYGNIILIPTNQNSLKVPIVFGTSNIKFIKLWVPVLFKVKYSLPPWYG